MYQRINQTYVNLKVLYFSTRPYIDNQYADKGVTLVYTEKNKTNALR